MLAVAISIGAGTAPVVFWASDSVAPGNVVLLYGGGLSQVENVRVWRLPDGDAKTPQPKNAALSAPASAPSQPTMQPRDGSLKFIVPEQFAPGLFAAELQAGAPAVIVNRPQLWFLQPAKLLPGLTQNEAAAGATVQLIGKDFLLPDDKGSPRVALRAQTGGTWRTVQADTFERFSLTFKLPTDLPEGNYQLCAHNGFGGAAGWSEALTVRIRRAEQWPTTVFNVKEFGARGDDVTDDTAAIRKALAAAEKNGGGVVYLPWGTYRLTDWICLPERTVLRGEQRDATILKWPVDDPQSLADFKPAAIYGAAPYAVEDLSFIARKVDTIFVDLSYGRGIPKELQPRLKPWGATRDVFFRRVNFAHWLMSGHPERQIEQHPEIWAKKYNGDGAYNFRNGNITNFEVSDCLFQGGHNHFTNIKNARITGNSFGNAMGYNWTVLGGGAHYVVASDNELRASSSWGYGQSGMKYIYSARNKSYNFVRGEREAMTLDISALPTARPVAQYWGAPIAVGNTADKPFLRFANDGKVNADGFPNGFTPGSFRDGMVYVRAYNGGTGAGQSRRIVDNNADTIWLEKPFDKTPETTASGAAALRGYIEIEPRNGNRAGPTAAWFGVPDNVDGLTLSFKKANFIPREFEDMAVLILDGKGAGQYREIKTNTTNELTLERAWDVPPDAGSTVGIWSVMRHMVVYKSEGYDTSAFAQLWGSFYDYIVEGCRVERSQGIWGQSGWFVQFRYNDVRYANTYHPGIGPRGNNPEKNLPFSFIGLMDGNLRITKFGAVQYNIPNGQQFFVNEVVPKPVPGLLGGIIKGNTLRYNQRIAVPPSVEDKPKDQGLVRFVDVLIDGNRIEHSPVGIQIGPHAIGVAVVGNQFEDVKQPLLLAKPEQVIGPKQ